MRLYYSPGACSLAAHIVLLELDEAFEPVLISLKDEAQRSPEFLQINPHGLVPVLDAGNFVLTESAAILAWLAQCRPQARLWPDAGSEAAARCGEWLAWLSSSLHIGFAQLWRAERFASDAAAQAAIASHGRERLRQMFAEIDARLAGQPWACGADYSVADAALLPFWRWGDRLGFGMETHYPAWTAHALRMGERPAVQQALAAEGIALQKPAEIR